MLLCRLSGKGSQAEARSSQAKGWSGFESSNTGKQDCYL